MDVMICWIETTSKWCRGDLRRNRSLPGEWFVSIGLPLLPAGAPRDCGTARALKTNEMSSQEEYFSGESV